MKKQTVNRRDFIKGGAVAAAAIGLPTFVPGTVVGEDARVLFPLLDGGGSVFRQFGRLLRGGGGEAEEGEE